MRLRCWRNALPGVQFCRAADVAGRCRRCRRSTRSTSTKTAHAIDLHTNRLQLPNSSPCWNPTAGIFFRWVLGATLGVSSQAASLAPTFPAYSRRFVDEASGVCVRGMTFVRKVARANSTNRLNCRTVGSCGRSRIDRQHNDDDAGRRSTATTCESSTPLGSRTIGARGSLRGTNNNRGEIEAAAVLTLCYDRRIVIAPPLRDGMAAPTCQSCQ